MVFMALLHFVFPGKDRINPYTAEIGKGYGTCRALLQDAIREGIGDGTIRADLDPFLSSMYLMISFMGTLSLEDRWKLAVEAEGFSYGQFTSRFFRFILPALASGEKFRDAGDFEPYGFVLTEPVEPGKNMWKRS